QCLAGMAPVSYQSGKVSVVYLRYQCNRFLRATLHLWVDLSRHYCDWARIYYDAHRKKGRAALLGNALAENCRRHDPQPHPLRLCAPRAQSTPTRILGVAVDPVDESRRALNARKKTAVGRLV